MDTADGVVAGSGQFEELMVCGQELAAGTVQLVSASRVKAPAESASKRELEATAGLSSGL